MENLFIYLLKVYLAVALFYLIYRLILNKNTNHKVKRFYLLGSLCLALILPFIKLSFDLTKKVKQTVEVFDLSSFEKSSLVQILPNEVAFESAKQFNSFSFAFGTYLFICLIFLCGLLLDLIKVRKSIKRNKQDRRGTLKLVFNKDFQSPFSFFNYIFTKAENNFLNTPEYFHELAHVKQFHSIDRLLLEVFRSLLWLNPFIYLFKKSMIEVHEHLADVAVLKNGIEAIDYQKYLFLQLKSSQLLRLTSNFNYSLTKKRITMISKNISKRKSLVRTLLGFTLIGGIFIFYGFNNQRIIDPIELNLRYDTNDLSINIPSILPLKPRADYLIGAQFGMRKHPILGYLRKHNGFDIKAERGTEVIATANGVVTRADPAGGYGNCVRIKHNSEFETRYAHLNDFNVKAGDEIKKGDVIGYVGSTGLSDTPHLHYEVLKDGKYVDPANYIKNIKEIPTKTKEK